MAIRFWSIAVLALLTLSAAPAAAEAKAGPRDTRSHLVLIVLENHEYGEVVGSPEAPFLNSLAARGTLATRYYAVAHPSLPNYLALLGGSTFGITGSCTECSARGGSLALQLSYAGYTWRAYMEGMPHSCFGGARAGPYVKRHDPFMYFPSIPGDGRRCANVTTMRRLNADLRRHSLPDFAWIGPDLCHAAHDCGIGVADRYVSRLAPRLTRQLGPHGLLVVTFDEGTSDAGGRGTSGGGRVMTVLVGPDVPRGENLTQPMNHYSLLAGLEDRFGLPRLRSARQARALPLTLTGNVRRSAFAERAVRG